MINNAKLSVFRFVRYYDLSIDSNVYQGKGGAKVMAEWLSDFIGWTLGQSSSTYINAVDQMIYMSCAVFGVVGSVMVLAYIGRILDRFTGGR